MSQDRLEDNTFEGMRRSVFDFDVHKIAFAIRPRGKDDQMMAVIAAVIVIRGFRCALFFY